eukprot:TRINITY_DN39947_c0_g1_i1.p1 TRINITY_DN39947_c0_g1~~TRINITY_DN39947_c0_g1_i1.p1  ORF type:complete len:286 (+),score=46.44 TRINITY_DN39947_c0_g1_i1:65-922(+)
MGIFFASEKAAPAPPRKEPLHMGDISEAELEKYGYVLTELGPGDRRTFPRKGDIVTFSFHCWLVQGKEVAASSKVKSKVGVGRLIRGLDRALIKMSKGQRCKLLCAANHAYGMYEVPGIEAGASLIFELELWEVTRQETASAAREEAMRYIPRPYASPEPQSAAHVPRHVPDPTQPSAPSPIPPPSGKSHRRGRSDVSFSGAAGAAPPAGGEPASEMVVSAPSTRQSPIPQWVAPTVETGKPAASAMLPPGPLGLAEVPAGLRMEQPGAGEPIPLDAVPVPAPDD